MVQFVSLVFKMSATEMVSVGIELISLALAEECRKIGKKSTSSVVGKTLDSTARTTGSIDTTTSKHF
jgi:hypothetical protein